MKLPIFGGMDLIGKVLIVLGAACWQPKSRRIPVMLCDYKRVRDAEVTRLAQSFRAFCIFRKKFEKSCLTDSMVVHICRFTGRDAAFEGWLIGLVAKYGRMTGSPVKAGE